MYLKSYACFNIFLLFLAIKGGGGGVDSSSREGSGRVVLCCACVGEDEVEGCFFFYFSK